MKKTKDFILKSLLIAVKVLFFYDVILIHIGFGLVHCKLGDMWVEMLGLLLIIPETLLYLYIFRSKVSRVYFKSIVLIDRIFNMCVFLPTIWNLLSFEFGGFLIVELAIVSAIFMRHMYLKKYKNIFTKSELREYLPNFLETGLSVLLFFKIFCMSALIQNLIK